MSHTTEYLLVIDKNHSLSNYLFCDSLDRFDEWLEKNIPSLEIGEASIQMQGHVAFGYEVHTDEVSEKEQRFFHIKITQEGDEEEFEGYVALVRAVRKAVNELGHLEVLWDDVSLDYSVEAYERINQIENLMRKLITYFMFTNIGMGWTKETVPDDVKQAANSGKKQQYRSFLERLDFIHLADFLFKLYATGKPAELQKLLDETEGPIDQDLLEPFVPRSNWDRYFSEIVNCDGNKLKDQWVKLYDLRCKVAHNAIIDKGDHEDIVRLADTLETYLTDAIDNIGQVEVPDEDKATVIKSIPDSTQATVGRVVMGNDLNLRVEGPGIRVESPFQVSSAAIIGAANPSENLIKGVLSPEWPNVLPSSVLPESLLGIIEPYEPIFKLDATEYPFPDVTAGSNLLGSDKGVNYIEQSLQRNTKPEPDDDESQDSGKPAKKS